MSNCSLNSCTKNLMPSAPVVRPHYHDHDPGSATASSKAKHRLSSPARVQTNHRHQRREIVLKSVMNMLSSPAFVASLGRASILQTQDIFNFPTLSTSSSQDTNECFSFWALQFGVPLKHCSRSSKCSRHFEDVMISIRFFQHLPASSIGFLSTWTIQLPPVESKMALGFRGRITETDMTWLKVGNKLRWFPLEIIAYANNRRWLPWQVAWIPILHCWHVSHCQWWILFTHNCILFPWTFQIGWIRPLRFFSALHLVSCQFCLSVVVFVSSLGQITKSHQRLKRSALRKSANVRWWSQLPFPCNQNLLASGTRYQIPGVRRNS